VFTASVNCRRLESGNVEDWVQAPVSWDIQNESVLAGLFQQLEWSCVRMLELSRVVAVVCCSCHIGVSDGQ